MKNVMSDNGRNMLHCHQKVIGFYFWSTTGIHSHTGGKTSRFEVFMAVRNEVQFFW